MRGLSAKNQSFLEKLGGIKARKAPQGGKGAGPDANKLDINDDVKKAVALLHVFDWAEIVGKFSLRQVAENPQRYREEVTAKSFRAPGHRNRYARSLNKPVRKEWLKLVASPDEALDILKGFPDRIQTRTQKYFEAILKGKAKFEFRRMSPPDLKKLQTAGRWANRISPGLFSEEAVKEALPVAKILLPFHHLLSEKFVGRKKFEEKLAAFVRYKPRGKKGWPFRRLMLERVMLIEGIGGVGKTSLLGRFVIDNWHDQRRVPLPFSYLACDDKTLNIRSLSSFVTAIDRDLEDMEKYLRRKAGKGKASGLFKKISSDLEDALESTPLTKSEASSPSTHGTLEGRISVERDHRDTVVAILGRLIDHTAELFERSGNGHPGFLLVIDSFEEAQYRTDEFLEPFWNFLEHLLTSSRRLKIIIIGRPPIKKAGFARKQEVETLEDLTPEYAKQLLELETGRPAKEFGPLVEQIGRNPLNLRLAARIIKDEVGGNKSFKGIKSSHLGWLKVGPEVIRGQLYRRLLDHIKNDKVRKLAHPGMILRRVTPEIIQQVLAKVCDLGVITADDAESLYTELGFEHTLVSTEADGSLRYRADVREPVLKLLKQDKEAMVRKCHQAAISYYSTKTDDVSRTERLYHELMLGNIPKPGDSFWHPQLAHDLAGSLNELPIESKAWLASQTRMKISAREMKRVDIKEKEKIIGREALTALNYSGPEAALDELKKLRSRSPDSALHAIEIRSLMSLGKLNRALARLEKVIQKYPAIGNKGRLIELLWLKAQCLTRQKKIPEALTCYDELIRLTIVRNHRIASVQALSAKLTILTDKDARTRASETLKAQMEKLTADEISDNIGVVRFAFGKLNQGHALGLIHIGRAVINELYDIIPQSGRWQFNHDYFEKMQNRAKDENPQTRENFALKEMIGSISEDNKIETRELLSTLSAINYTLNPKTGQSAPVPNTVSPGFDIDNSALGMTSVWALTNMELGDFSSATISGIDDYRDDWEREDFFSESFLA